MIKKINAKNGTLMSPSLPWKKIKDDFIKGFRTIEGHVWPGYKELAEKYNTAPKTISTKANQPHEKWLEKQRMYIEKFNQLQLNEQGVNLVKESAEFDKKCFSIAQKAVEKLEEKILSPLEKDETELGRLSRIGNVLSTFQRIGQEALGVSKRESGPITQYNIISFSQGLDNVMSQIKANPDMLGNIEADIIDVK